MEELFNLVKKIPEGSVASYGDLGASLTNRVSGLIVGHWMSSCDQEIPWWRVVAKDGRLVVFKKDAATALVQRKLLEDEGVTFNEDRVDVAKHIWDPELA